MKKIFAIILGLVLLLGMAACGSGEPEVTAGNPVPAPTSQSEELTPRPEETAAPAVEEGYSFLLKETVLMPGAVFDESKMPQYNEKFEVHGVAGEGSGILYLYNVVEVTVLAAGEEPVIYSISLLDSNTSTDEGLYLGDDIATVEAIYGTDYTNDNNTMVYEKGSTQLRIIVNNGTVFNIEYRMITS